MNRKLMVAALVVCAAFGASNSVRAQTLPSITVPPSSANTPYVLDSQRTIVRNATGECWRTGYWSVELAQSTPVVGSDFPAGCICDKALMPKPVCEPPPVVVPPPAPAAMVPPPPVPTSQKVTIPADALFQFDKSSLSDTGKSTLTEFSNKVKTLNLEAVVAVGHTDRIGSEAYNQKLSERRAQTVKDFLVGQGIAADRVYIEGRGKSQPVTTDCSAGKDSPKNKKLIECLAPDRRVVIEAVGSPR